MKQYTVIDQQTGTQVAGPFEDLAVAHRVKAALGDGFTCATWVAHFGLPALACVMQELDGEILGDMPGALWRLQDIDTYRVQQMPATIDRIVVAVDPAVTNTEDSDEHGIVVAGIKGDEGYVLEDGSLKGSPLTWAKRAVALYDHYAADAIVVEVNQGGDMVKQTLKSVREGLNIREVRATRGKHVRAEPIAALYEQGRVHHVGSYPELETQMTMTTNAGYEGENSPDRLDAAVWALTELFPEMIEVPNAEGVMSKLYGRSGRGKGYLAA